MTQASAQISASAPLVSVVIPTFRRSGTLLRAVESVRSQTYANVEIVVANDNVPGDEYDAAVRREFALLNDARLRVVGTSGGVGGGAARNMACRVACGEYLAFLDDDDEYLPDKIETQLRFMLEGDLDMSWQDVAWFDGRGKLVERRVLDHCGDFSREGLLRAHLLTPISPTSIYMLRKSLFERTEGFGEVRTGQDWWLMLRCIEAGAKIAYMPGVHVRQYIHGGERLSTGRNKIEGERARHEVVRSFYPRLSRGDIRYIEFRHWAALAFACARGRMPVHAFGYACRAALASPRACLGEGRRFLTEGKHE